MSVGMGGRKAGGGGGMDLVRPTPAPISFTVPPDGSSRWLALAAPPFAIRCRCRLTPCAGAM